MKDNASFPEGLDILARRVQDVETTIREILPTVSAEDMRDKLLEVIRALQKEFPTDGSLLSFEERAMAFYSLKYDFRGSVVLHALGIDASAIVDIHGILERFALKSAAFQLARSKLVQEAIEPLLERHTLREMGPLFKNLGIWTKSDATFVNMLNRVRNGLAHKNPRQISKLLLGGAKLRGPSDFDKAAASISFPEIVARSARLLVKLYRAYEKQQEDTKLIGISKAKK